MLLGTRSQNNKVKQNLKPEKIPPMQTIDKFNSNLGTAILIVGGAGVGKTTLAMRLTNGIYVFVADLNFQSGLDYLKKIHEESNVVGFDTASPDENGKIIVPNMRYTRMLDKLTAAMADPKVTAIMLDSTTFIEDIFKAKICSATTEAAIKLSGYDHWGSLVLVWKSTIMQIRQSGKLLIMVAHEGKERDESDSIYKYQIAVDGSIRDKFPALFSDVWRCEIAESLGTHTWNVRMLGNTRQEHLKRSTRFSDLPAVTTQDNLAKLCKQRLSSPSTPAATQTLSVLPKT